MTQFLYQRDCIRITAIATWAVGVLVPTVLLSAQPHVPVTGQAVAELARIDKTMLSFMLKHRVPGGALAAARGGRDQV